MPHPRNAGWQQGDHWICCDVCGFEYRASQIRIRWDGMAVCPQDYEERHPQDFLRARKDDPRVWPVRTCAAVSGLVCPVPIAPRNNETIHNATSANLQWNTVAGITSYQVFVWASSGSAPTSPTATVTITDGSTIGSYFATGLSSETAYSWYVNSVFDGVAAENCRTDYGRSFTTAVAAPSDVVVNYDGADSSPFVGPFSLNLFSGATAYALAATMTGTAVDTVNLTLDYAITTGSAIPSSGTTNVSWNVGETGQKITSPFSIVMNIGAVLTITASAVTGTATLGATTTGTITRP